MKITDLESYKVVSTPQIAKPTKKKEDLLTKSSNVLGSIFPGTKTIGESIGTLGLAGKQALTGEFKQAKETLATQPTVPELIGAYTSAGAQAYGVTGGGLGGGVISDALKNAGLGALISGGATASEGGSAKDVAKSGALGFGVGGSLSLASSGAQAGLRKIADSLPERFINSATGQSKKELLAGKGISKYVLENKKIGTTQQLIDQSQEAIDKADEFINSALKSSTDKTIKLDTLVNDIVDQVNTAGGSVDAIKIKTILNNLAPQVEGTLAKDTLTLAEANTLRSQLDKTLGSNAFINAQLPFNKGVLKDFTNALRNTVKDTAPIGVRDAFNTYSKEITLRDLLLSKSAQASRNQVIGLGDMLFGGFGGVSGGIPGAVIGVGARKFSESTIAKTGAGVIIQSLDKSLSPILAQLEPTVRTAILTAIVDAMREDQNTTTPLQPRQK